MDVVTVSMIGVVVTAGVGYVSYNQGKKKEAKQEVKDTKEEGQDLGSMKSDIKYIMRRTDDVLLEQKDTNKNLNLLSERVTRVEESAKSAHKRIDQIEENSLKNN